MIIYLRVRVRNESKFKHHENPEIEVMVGDATKSDNVAKVVVGTDVVVSCFGYAKRGHMIEKSHSNIPAVATEQEKIPRGVFISSLGCGGTSGLIKTRFIMIGGKSSFTRMMNLYLWNDICAVN